MPTRSLRRRLAVILAFVTVLVEVPCLRNGFVNWDDPNNFLFNPHLDSIRWALTNHRLGVYQPLAWLAYEAQYGLWKLSPLGYHLVSLLLHAAVSVGLFLVAEEFIAFSSASLPGEIADKDNGRRTVAAFLAAAWFAVEPLRVEAVAWVSCQSTLWCALFLVVGLGFYFRSRAGEYPRRWLLLGYFFFALSLLSRPNALGLPLALLALDLAAARPRFRFAFREKLPLFVLAALAAGMAVWARHEVGAISATDRFSMTRVAAAAWSILFYLAKTAWPFPVNPYYETATLSFSGLAVGLVLGLSAVLWFRRRRAPQLCAGWLMYLALLVPTLGVLSAGQSALVADRYCYLPSIALTLVLASALTRVRFTRGAAVMAMGGLAFFAVASYRQCGIWHDSLRLWQFARDHGAGRSVDVHMNLGTAWEEHGDRDLALRQFNEVLKLSPENPRALYNAGVVLIGMGRWEEAIDCLNRSVRRRGDFAEARNNLGFALTQKGRYVSAIEQLRLALRIRPDFPEASNNLAMAYVLAGMTSRAMEIYRVLTTAYPGYAKARYNYARLLVLSGDKAGAEREFTAASNAGFAPAREARDALNGVAAK